jgi:DNA-binding transcriptional LysR family regulator
MPLTIAQLRAFLVAAKAGSFTAAATELSIAQASMSELIRRIEDDHGVALFRRGRQLTLTAAGTELLPYAEQAVAAADLGSQALQSLRALDGGVATFGLLRNADHYLLSDLVSEFHRQHPQVRVRLVGLNSVEVAAAVAGGELEAGLVVLPIDDDGLTVTPLLRDEVLYASVLPDRLAEPMTTVRLSESPLILYDAHYGWSDPTRRQLAERAQLAGVKIEPMIEVEHVELALDLVARGVGDTIVARAVADSRLCPPGIGTVAFDPPLWDTVALIQRRAAVLSPATMAIANLAQQMLLGPASDQRPSQLRSAEATSAG